MSDERSRRRDIDKRETRASDSAIELQGLYKKYRQVKREADAKAAASTPNQQAPAVTPVSTAPVKAAVSDPAQQAPTIKQVSTILKAEVVKPSTKSDNGKKLFFVSVLVGGLVGQLIKRTQATRKIPSVTLDKKKAFAARKTT